MTTIRLWWPATLTFHHLHNSQGSSTSSPFNHLPALRDYRLLLFQSDSKRSSSSCQKAPPDHSNLIMQKPPMLYIDSLMFWKEAGACRSFKKRKQEKPRCHWVKLEPLPVTPIWPQVIAFQQDLRSLFRQCQNCSKMGHWDSFEQSYS